MTAPAWIFAAIAVVAAIANWWSAATDHHPTELWSKPLTLLALIGVAVTLDPADPAVRVWFVIALAFSLAGDVLLLDDRRFVFGLAAFLCGHLAYTAGFIAAPDWRWWSAAVALGALDAPRGGRRQPHRRRRTSGGPEARGPGRRLPDGHLGDGDRRGGRRQLRGPSWVRHCSSPPTRSSAGGTS